jgi:DNA-binding MarR family transcriptional regulator
MQGWFVDEETTHRLRLAIARLGRELTKFAGDEGLTPSQAAVLTQVAKRGSIGLSELARTESINPTMLSRLISRLEAADLISRAPDPNDLRSAVVTITPAGTKVQDAIKVHRATVIGRAAEGLSPDEQRSLVDALPALESLVEQLRGQRS